MKYKHKSIPVNAVQFFDNKKCFNDIKSRGIPIGYDYQNVPHFFINHGGRLTLNDGDWIVTEITGDYTIYCPEIFEDEYELVT